jgi:hypothetical protein
MIARYDVFVRTGAYKNVVCGTTCYFVVREGRPMLALYGG